MVAMTLATCCVVFDGWPRADHSAAKPAMVVGVTKGATALILMSWRAATSWDARSNPVTPCLDEI